MSVFRLICYRKFTNILHTDKIPAQNSSDSLADRYGEVSWDFFSLNSGILFVGIQIYHNFAELGALTDISA